MLNGIVGYYDSDAGTVLINGESPGEATAHRVGFTTQESCFYADITVKDNIKYFGNL